MSINAEYRLNKQSEAPVKVVQHIRKMDPKNIELLKSLLSLGRYDYPSETMSQRLEFRLNRFPEETLKEKLEVVFFSAEPGLRVKYHKAVRDLMGRINEADRRVLVHCKKEAPDVFEGLVQSNDDLEEILRFMADCSTDEPEVEADWSIDLDQAFSSFKHYSQ